MDFAIYLVLAIIILILIVFIRIKDKQNERRSDRFEHALTDAMQENFILKKELYALKQTIADANLENISKKIDDEIESKISPIIMSIQTIDEIVRKNTQQQQQFQQQHLEQQQIKINDADSVIVNEFRNGKSIEQIASEYGVSVGRVEFVLKFNKLI